MSMWGTVRRSSFQLYYLYSVTLYPWEFDAQSWLGPRRIVPVPPASRPPPPKPFELGDLVERHQWGDGIEIAASQRGAMAWSSGRLIGTYDTRWMTVLPDWRRRGVATELVRATWMHGVTEFTYLRNVVRGSLNPHSLGTQLAAHMAAVASFVARGIEVPSHVLASFAGMEAIMAEATTTDARTQKQTERRELREKRRKARSIKDPRKRETALRKLHTAKLEVRQARRENRADRQRLAGVRVSRELVERLRGAVADNPEAVEMLNHFERIAGFVELN